MLITLLLALGVVVMAESVDAAEQAAVPRCEPQSMVKFLNQGVLSLALAEAEQCIAFHEKEVLDLPVTEEINSRNAWDLLSVGALGVWYCSSAQLSAMKGDFGIAKLKLDRARAWGTKWYGLLHSIFFIGWEGLISVTDGFILEKQARVVEAKERYKRTSRGTERLAVLALREGQYDEASRLADEALGDGTWWVPTAWVVRGAVAEARGVREAALKSYEKALTQMEKERPNNQFEALYFAERESALAGVKRLKTGTP